LEWRITLALT